MNAPFDRRVLNWFDRYGRKNLPWQRETNAYKVWVSEVMLQQTRVETVIPYFERFMQRFPDIRELASAPIDEVLHHWSGLGYYARARNLQKAAQQVMAQHQGKLPISLPLLQQLPGIGRSTAGAIYSLGMQKRAAILDGNVKRVLARHAGIEGWAGTSSVAKQLWELAEQRTPVRNFAAYNQAMMDLGAMICTRTQAKCRDCPVAEDCVAQNRQLQHLLPTPKPKKVIPVKQVTMLMVMNSGREVLLQKRAASGIWGGLWGFPEFETKEQAQAWFAGRFGSQNQVYTSLQLLTHAFTHFRLEIEPLLIRYNDSVDWVMEDGQWLWYNGRSDKVGLASPVSKLISYLESNVESTV